MSGRGRLTAPPLSIASVAHRMAVCRICSGELELTVRGSDVAPTAAAFSPSAHQVGRHGDLLALPRVRDGPAARPAHGRRAARRSTARCATTTTSPRRTAGARPRTACSTSSARTARAGGCSTSAAATACCSTRRASAATRPSGLELSREAAPTRARDAGPRRARAAAGGVHRGHQRRLAGRLRRDRARRRDRAPRRPGRRRSTQCAALLRPGGVLCVVTPDPSSATAKLAGTRWWGYLPAHTVLLPRRTLRELISGVRARDLRGRAVRAHVRGQALGRRPGGAARAGRRAA